jgi:hypothetical protein
VRASRWFAVAFLSTVGALIVYAHGFWAGRFLELAPTSEYCVSKPLGDPATSWTWLPLRHLCHWQDGTTTDLVPGYVNPLVILLIVGAVTGTVMCALTLIGRSSRDTDRNSTG